MHHTLLLLLTIIALSLAPLYNQPNNQAFLATRITFQADIPFSKSEFFYLTGLKPNSIITPQQLEYARKQLKRKKRFEKIETTILSHKTGKQLHFSLTAHWMFKKLIISGIWFGKHIYENLYLQHPGEIFDVSLHEEARTAMKKLLYQNGYFACSIQDEFLYNRKEKSITVKMRIDKGHRARINRIDVQGKTVNLFLVKPLLLKKIHHQLTSLLLYKRYSKKILTKARERIKTILTKEGFTKQFITLKRCITNEGKRIRLLFELTIGNKKLFTFKGNRFFSDKQLTEETIDLEKPVWLLDPNIIAEQIVHAYHQYGFWHAKIHHKKIAPHHHHFEIEEGPRITVNSVIVKEVTTGKEEKNKFFFQPLLQAKYYDESALNTCAEQLKNFYIEHGFWDFSITDQQFIKETPNHYSIVLCVKRGLQRFFENKPLSPTQLTQQRIAILKKYQKQGFWYVDAQPILKTLLHEKNVRQEISVDWNITPGEQVTFGKIFLRGSTRLPFNRIMKELTFKDGDLWDKKKLDYSRNKLKKLDIFKHIEIYPKKISDQQSKKPIVLTLIDDDPFELRLRSGYFLTSKNFLLKRESTYKLGGSLFIKNPLNLADKLSFITNATRFEKNFDFCYQVPYPLSSPIITKFNAYYYKYIHPLEVGKSDSAYEAVQNGILVGITKEYKTRSFWGITIGNEWMRTRRARGNLKLARNMINTTIPYLFIEPNLLIDYLDDKINTMHGSLTFCSIKIMVPHTNRSTTFKIMVDHSQFHHFGKKVVGALRFRWGHIFREKFEEIMPIERFYLGGPLSVRGYSKDTVPPLGVTRKRQPDGTWVTEYTIQGGSSMINGNAELRFPIYKSFGGVIFQDVGALSQTGCCHFALLAPASGCGLRYQTPIGALRFDIGWKWKKSFPTDTRYAWYLTLGQAF